MKKRLNETIIVGMFFLILTVVSCKIYEINIGGNTENAIVTEESVGKEQQKDIEETIEIQEETESFVEETEEPCYEDQVLVEEIEDQYLVYDHYHEIVDAEKWDMPYADQETFEIIQSAYEEVDFLGEFEKGNLEVYDEYKKLFAKLVWSEKPFWDKETGEEIYLKDYVLGDDYDVNEVEYHFYDVDGDSYPELEIVYNCQKYIFKYDLKQERYILWDWFGTWWRLIGTQKIQGRELEKYFYFCQFDENGKNKCVTFFFSDRRTEGYLYIVMLPIYEEKKKEVVVTDEMKEQGMFVRLDGQWYFRVTEEQYEELTETYWEADFQAQEELEEVTYTYDELFGSLE